jgi:nuclear transport factor 2 (NTF2) superfamily protein
LLRPFDVDGLVRRRNARINDETPDAIERRFLWTLGIMRRATIRLRGQLERDC